MKINVVDKVRETKKFADLPIGTPFFEDSLESDMSDVDMMLMKCVEGKYNGYMGNGSLLNAVYLSDGTFTWVHSDKEVIPIDARVRIEVRL